MINHTFSRWTAALLVTAALALAPAARADIAEGSEGPSVDPFRALIQEPVVVAPPLDSTPLQVPAPPIVPPPQPVSFSVTALALDGANRVAVIEFQGQTYIVQEGMKIPDASSPAMEIKTVSDEKVVVVDTKLSQLVTKQLSTN